MSLSFLNISQWILLLTTITVVMVYYAITRRNVDKKMAIAVYYTVALFSPFLILSRLVNEVFTQYKKYEDFIFYIILSLLLALLIELTYLGVTHQGDEQSKRMIRIGFYFFLFALFLIIVLTIMYFLGI